MGLWARLEGLRLEISDHVVEPLDRPVPGGWTRRTTLLRLRGRGEEGVGEDVAYTDEDQFSFRLQAPGLDLAGSYTLDEFSRRLDDFDLCPTVAGGPAVRLYRRWTFESAALDLALRQAGTSLAGALGMTPRPLTFVCSMGLGADATRLERRLRRYPDLRFKLDLSTEWTAPLVAVLERSGAVDTVDLKGQYKGSFTGPAADPELYRLVAEGLPGAWLEDPGLNDETESVLEPHRQRVTWDAPIHSVADIARLPFRPRCVNIKPSRFGLLAELFRTYEYCDALGIGMYGGGQFELGPGRDQIQYLASLFHPDGPNDVAPREFNEAELADGLPASPLAVAPAATGFRLKE